MRILVVSHAAATFEVSKGGADLLALRHAAFLSREFADVGYVGVPHPMDPQGVTYFAVADTDLLAYDRLGPRGASFGFLLNHFLRAVKAALVANRECRAYRPDVLITHTSIATILLKVLRPRTPLVYTIHDGLFVHRTVEGRSARLIRFLMNNVLELAAVHRADHILCVSSSIYAQLRGAGVSENKLSVVPFVPVPVDVGTPNRLEGIPSGLVPLVSPFILTVGQQTGRKRFDLLIEAMPFVKSPVHLVVVGDGPLARHYDSMVHRLGLSSRVHLLRGVSDAQLIDLYSHARAFFLVSENEGFPITIGEALSYGCPSVLICPNIESISEYPTDLARLVRALPPAQEIARLMDDAYQASSARVGTPASGPPGPHPSGSGPNGHAMKSVYDHVFHRVLGLTQTSYGSARI